MSQLSQSLVWSILILYAHFHVLQMSTMCHTNMLRELTHQAELCDLSIGNERKLNPRRFSNSPSLVRSTLERRDLHPIGWVMVRQAWHGCCLRIENTIFLCSGTGKYTMKLSHVIFKVLSTSSRFQPARKPCCSSQRSIGSLVKEGIEVVHVTRYYLIQIHATTSTPRRRRFGSNSNLACRMSQLVAIFSY